MSSEITKTAVRYRYPWASLEIGDTFTIPADNRQGCDNARQLCYAASKASEKNGEPKKFKSFKNADTSVIIKRIA